MAHLSPPMKRQPQPQVSTSLLPLPWLELAVSTAHPVHAVTCPSVRTEAGAAGRVNEHLRPGSHCSFIERWVTLFTSQSSQPAEAGLAESTPASPCHSCTRRPQPHVAPDGNVVVVVDWVQETKVYLAHRKLPDSSFTTSVTLFLLLLLFLLTRQATVARG